jgi:hypothetical protein
MSATQVTGRQIGGVDANDLPVSGASAGTYGSATQVAVVTVDNKGRVTSAANLDISFPTTPFQPLIISGITGNISINAAGLQARSIILRGAPGAAFNVTVADVVFSTLITNETTQVATVKRASTGGQALAAGLTAQFYYDGS